MMTSWNDELADTLGKLSELLNRDTRRQMGGYVKTEFEIEDTQGPYGYRRVNTGWITVQIRYRIDPSITQSTQLSLGRQPNDEG